ncbi:MAG: ATP-binding protein [Planctomycetaceae bacterium]|nr:ATP-binding protein [Planctomycetaceae bacterium]
MANDWDNLYPICKKCNPTNASHFPVYGKRCSLPTVEAIVEYEERPTGKFVGWNHDRPILVDPCGKDDLRKFLMPLPDGQLLQGLSQRGDETIEQFNLNQPELVARRKAAFDERLSLLADSAPIAETRDKLFDFPAMEFGGVWFLLLYQIALRIGGGGGGRPTLSVSRIWRYYTEVIQAEGFSQKLGLAAKSLQTAPIQVKERKQRVTSGAVGSAPRSIKINNFKALEDIEIGLPTLDPSRPKGSGAAMLILGENAAGKSSILEALALALTTDEVRDDLRLRTERFILKPELMGGQISEKRHEASILAYYDHRDSKVEDKGNVPEDQDPQVMLKITEAGMTEVVRGEIPPRLPVYAYGAFRLFLNADKRQRPSARLRTLFDAQYVLPNPEKWMSGLNSPGDFEEVARVLRSVISASGAKYSTIEADRENGRCYILREERSTSGDSTIVRTPFRDVSSGYRAVIGMVCDIMRWMLKERDGHSTVLSEAKAIVLIDEIEAHLHPLWKMQILHGLRRALPNVIFIVTTHDPLCLRGLQGSQVRVLRRLRRDVKQVGLGSLPEHVEQLIDFPTLGNLTLDQLLTSDLFGMFSTEDPITGKSIAEMGDLLARDETDEANEIRKKLRGIVSSALPLGATQVEQLVLNAVQRYVIDRRSTQANEIRQLDRDAKDEIVRILNGI